MSGSLRVGRLAGIPFGIHPLWLVVVALLTVAFGDGFFADRLPDAPPAATYALGLVSVLLLFAAVVAHELGHAVVARREGVDVEEIDLWLLGGVARLRGPIPGPEAELRFGLAGPAVTFVIALVLGAAAGALAVAGDPAPALGALVEQQAFMNATILVFNLLPAFPLDGGRVLRALLWRRSGDQRRATHRAAEVGRLFGIWLIASGLLGFVGGAPGALWFAIIGAFVFAAAAAEDHRAAILAVLGGHPASEVMRFPAVAIPAATPVEAAIRDFFAPMGFQAFPVVDDAGRPVGLLSRHDVARVPPGRRGAVTAGELAVRDPDLLVAPEADVAELLERPAFVRIGRAVVPTPGGVGLLSITDVERVVQRARLLPGG
jgi:Zn-dependent protease